MSGLIPTTGVVLAGGKSSRMGGAKEGLDFGGVSLLEYVVDRVAGVFGRVAVVARDAAELPRIEADVFRDCERGSGPLAGICGGLRALETPYAFVCACDMPLVSGEVVRLLWEHAGEGDVVIPRWEKGIEPLHAFYSRACLEPVQRALSAGKRRIVDFFHEVRVVEVGAEELSRVENYQESFVNLNTPGEYQQAVELMKRPGGRARRKG